MPTVERTWECKCGQVKAKLRGEPILNFRCHCHSCVGAARFIEEKTKKSGTPMLHPDGGGACASLYAAGNVEFVPGTLSDDDGRSRLKFVRVGDGGKAWRSHTTCCGTQMTNCVFPRLVVFNRNGIKNTDGTPYVPKGEVLNIQKSNAFDPATVPEPSHEKGPRHWVFLFMGTVVNPFGRKVENMELFPEASEAEVVPITWE